MVLTTDIFTIVWFNSQSSFRRTCPRKRELLDDISLYPAGGPEGTKTYNHRADHYSRNLAPEIQRIVVRSYVYFSGNG